MKWDRAVHHVEAAAEECHRVGALAPSFAPLRVSELWAFGAILGEPKELDGVSLALGVELSAESVAWATHPTGSEHWLEHDSPAEEPRAGLVALDRGADLEPPDRRHRCGSGTWPAASTRGALAALAEGRGSASGLPAPTHEELRQRLEDELQVSLAELRARTTDYDDHRWGRGSLEPYADALWRATYGYLDVLSAQPLA